MQTIVLTNFDDASLVEAEPLSKIDTHHPPLSIEINNANIKYMKSIKTPKINFYKLNYERIKLEIGNTNWNSLLNTDNIETATDKFYEKINSIIHCHISLIKPKNDKYPKWFTKNLIEILKKKELFRKLYKQSNNQQFLNLYKKFRRNFKNEKNKMRIEFHKQYRKYH